MKCTEIRELLPDLAAGLTPAAPETNDHLSSCAACSETLADFRKTMALLDEWQVPEPSPYFDTRLRARLREESAKQQRSWLSWVRRPALTAAMAAVIVASGAGIFLMERGNLGSAPPPIQPGTAISDLQSLDRNHDLFADPDPDSADSLLDVLEVQETNP
jgi:predicted anti-sigma-YlaC factor YlaD